jgi:hypothetical protein
VDHPLSAPDQLVRPWRLAAFVAATIAVLELIVLIAIGGGALFETLSDRLRIEATERALAPPASTEKKPAARRPAAATAKPSLTRRRTVIRVLNGNGRTGAAAAAASRVRRNGYRVGFVGNAASHDFARSLVMYKPGFAGEARRFARDLGIKQVSPLDGIRPRELGRAQLVFILGS